ncbi:putative integral membrane protein [Streptomyces ambofaciens ATCC 23877]|uniref:Putative integral membrane protein n=1 Tax=Streptomyces ambofaciens (strain ATCC 23877 / 3486 / DSM 40053 / JCM 4204 / NBRC 12836 / NRRL B-2516) TaxID=278992 RepID=A0ADC2_STRA7|nr:hypothetical protein [Streptomyces ambofaciens]AKZ59854.1 putative integral membrane protein [Streptomyces ambofaciens ATCC 23877]CAJ88478.1 putative integral membrane protein [Streptomyces ambofaciens ATCC 23877]
MADGANATLAGGRRGEADATSGTPRRLGGDALLAAVAGVFTVTQLIFVHPGMGLGWDETVYVSQVTSHHPAAFFSAPRSRGVSLLVAPVASWSSSTELLRVYLAVLSGLGLYLALRCWKGLFPARVLATAGAFFATLWVTLFYGPQAMPNYWVAVGALICVGCFLRAWQGLPGRAAPWGVVAGAALMAWMRPTDAVWVTLPLLVLVLVRRRPLLLLALVGGLAAGGVEWVIEAYGWYGGLGERLSRASEIQGGLGWNLAVDDQMRSLGGRGLCRPCTGAMPHPVVTAWWVLLPFVAVLGVAVAVRARRAARTLIPFACAGTAALPYLLMIGYAAPRFLQPAYALLAVPVADALWHLVRTERGRWRPVAATVVALALAGHLVVQLTVLEGTVDRNVESRRDWSRVAGELHRLGVRPPCLVIGHESIPIGYYAGCSSGATSGNNENTTAAEILDTARRVPVAAVTGPGGTTPGYARDWTPHRVTDLTVRVAPRR